MLNTMIYLQGALSNKKSWNVEKSALECRVIWAHQTLRHRQMLAKTNNAKFGFVIKSPRSC